MKRIIFSILGIIILFGLIFVFLHQNLINIGSELADEHCIKINPLIIQRKNLYIDFMKAVMSQGTDEEFYTPFNTYFETTKKYIVEENNWLKKHKKFTSRIDFRLLLPQNMQKIADTQFIHYETEKEISQLILDELNTKDIRIQEEIHNKIVEKVKIAKEASTEYDRLWNIPRSNWDMRKYIAKIPTPKCPIENYDIPDVPDYLGINK
ncbi:hypothetical protein A2W14_07465 [Candidatus Gottesmanbacteria bacterium RBG_16_37_8]|uniref:Uncharacterized protein n=1 Tax=Candidatus Gottesmanbacteria bacterium RBG_16_37_8 TaxID=1798371 RepID=A0A1F5YT45_9BACT|nr:MAG: hypothetical protein A2W14_07465 [Candidatus Gottesmanbacteria bacterium RBG_16_37_8]